MKTLKLIGLIIVFGLIAVSFQNCSEQKFSMKRDPASTGKPEPARAAVGTLVTPLNCGIHTHNQIWWENTATTRSVAQTCTYGGNRAEILRTEAEKKCLNGIISSTGNTREISEGFSGACNAAPVVLVPASCGAHASGTSWIEHSEENVTRACPSSAVLVTDVYDLAKRFSCLSGVASLVSESRVSLLRTIGTCPAQTCSAQFTSFTVLKNQPSSLGWTCVNSSTAKYSCSNGAANASAPLIGMASISTATKGVITCTVTGTNSAAQTQDAIATLTVRECSPGTTTTTGCASFANGSGSRTCAADGMSYGQCNYDCGAGYLISGARSGTPSCVALPRCEAGRVQCGATGFNRAGTEYSLNCGEDGYNYTRDTSADNYISPDVAVYGPSKPAPILGRWYYLGIGIIQLRTDATVSGSICCMKKNGSGLDCSTHTINVSP